LGKLFSGKAEDFSGLAKEFSGKGNENSGKRFGALEELLASRPVGRLAEPGAGGFTPPDSTNWCFPVV